MSNQNPYQVVFDGTSTGEYDSRTSKKRFQHLFKLPDNQLERLFTGKETVIKTNIPEDVAVKFAIKIANAGYECYIEPVLDENDPTLQPGFVEQRKSERRIRFRRPPRPGAMIPDRRLSVRRQTDAPEFQYP